MSALFKYNMRHFEIYKEIVFLRIISFSTVLIRVTLDIHHHIHKYVSKSISIKYML